MQFINNWSRAVTLAPGVTSLALDLPDGEYRLTLADSQFTPTRWEIVGATVAAGTATLARGLEGTSDQDWPTDSIIYCTATAGLLADLFSRLAQAEGSITTSQQDIAALDSRVAALEPSSQETFLQIAFVGWYYGAYPVIRSVEALVGGVAVHQFDLSLFTQAAGQGGSEVAYSASHSGAPGVVIGNNDATANISTATPFDASWEEIRIYIEDSYEFSCDASVLTSFDPLTVEGSASYIDGGAGSIEVTVPLNAA